jgi:hypothetical protein
MIARFSLTPIATVFRSSEQVRNALTSAELFRLSVLNRLSTFFHRKRTSQSGGSDSAPCWRYFCGRFWR